jgi:hypothetical protein
MDLDAALRGLRPSPDSAPLRLLVQRLPGEKRATPPSVTLDPDRGVLGDRWGAVLFPNPEAMVTLMRWDVARLLVDDPAILGDNLFADLDTSAANLPPGTIVQVGPARCEVTPKPHTGCAKFARRAGDDALAVTRSPTWKTAQLRGVHLRVLQGGEVRVGDELRVIARP